MKTKEILMLLKNKHRSIKKLLKLKKNKEIKKTHTKINKREKKNTKKKKNIKIYVKKHKNFARTILQCRLNLYNKYKFSFRSKKKRRTFRKKLFARKIFFYQIKELKEKYLQKKKTAIKQPSFSVFNKRPPKNLKRQQYIVYERQIIKRMLRITKKKRIRNITITKMLQYFPTVIIVISIF